MSEDQYEPGARRSLLEYPCGLRAGDRLRLKHDLQVTNDHGQRTGDGFRAGSLWTVVPGVASEPTVVWLHQPDGIPHTWDESVLDTFEPIATSPPVGALATLAMLPAWVSGMPEESRRLFALCVGRPLPVDEIDINGLVVLDASIFDREVGGMYNDIRVEAELLEESR